MEFKVQQLLSSFPNITKIDTSNGDSGDIHQKLDKICFKYWIKDGKITNLYKNIYS